MCVSCKSSNVVKPKPSYGRTAVKVGTKMTYGTGAKGKFGTPKIVKSR